MKHLKTILFLLTLMGSVGAWAETINLGTSANLKANATFYKNGSVQPSGVWCDKATKGYVMLTGSISSYSGNIEVVKYDNTSLTISVPSVMTITGYSLGLKIIQNGTATCTANNGGSDIELNASSATTVSASGLSTNAVTINFTGTGDDNGECMLEFSDFTIDVSGTFVSDASQLSNTKAYTVTTVRGTWTLSTDKTAFASTLKSSGTVSNDDADMSVEAQRFAIYKQGDYYYLYSLKAGKFVAFNGGYPEFYQYATIPYTVSASNYSPYPLRISTWDFRNYANNNNSGSIVINTFTSQDDGNRLAIAEAGDMTSDEITAINEALAASPLLNMHKAFTVTANRGTWCASSDGSKLSTKTVNTSPATGYDQFALMFFNNKFYLYNVGTKKFIKKDGSLAAGRGDAVYVRYTGDTSRPYMFYFPDGGIYFNMQGSGSYVMNTYGTPDDGNMQSVSQVDVDPYDDALEEYNKYSEVTYKILFNGNQIGSEVVAALKGSTPSVSSTWSAPAFCTLNYDPATIPNVDTDVNVTVNWTGPFKFSPSFSEAVWYYAKVRDTKYLRADEDAKDGSGRYQTNTTNEQTDVYKWAFTGNPYAISIMNKGAGDGKYLYFDSTAPIMKEVTPANDNKARWVVASSGSGFSVRSETGNNQYINDSGGNGNLGMWNSGWGASDAGSCWKIDEIPVQVIFNIIYGGNVVVKEASVNQNSQEAPSVPSSWQRDYVTFTYDVATVTPSTTTVNATATWNGPFKFSADFASAHWYDMAVRGNWYVTSDNVDGDGALKTIEANALGLAENAYQWAFVGDPWHLKVFNKAVGETKVYTWVDGSNAIPAFVASTSENYWTIVRGTRTEDKYANSFMLTIPGTTYRQLNQNGGAGGPLKFWTSTTTADEGSAFTVFDVPENFAPYVVDGIAPYLETTAKYFVLAEDAKTAIGYDESYKTECTFVQYKTMMQTLTEKLADNSNLVLPETGYYRFQRNNTGKYLGLNDRLAYGNFDNNKSPATIVKLTKGTGDNAGKYSIALQGRYLQAMETANAVEPNSNSEVFFTPYMTGVGKGTFSVTGADKTFLHATQGNLIFGWLQSDDNSQWIIEDAEDFDLKIGETGYSTLWVPFPVTIPDGVEAYTGTINNTGWLHLNAIEDVIPANTAVVLKGSAYTYNFDIADDVDAISGNVLLGSNGNVTGDGSSIYALSKKNDVIGFYLVDDGVRVPANKAYLNIPSAGVRGFKFVFDEETSIDRPTPNPSRNGGEVYDLSGRKINSQLSPVNSQLKKGVYIVNGRKVLF